jgi:HSP20 family protein
MAKQEKRIESKEVSPSRPFSEITRWEREMNRAFDDFLGRRTWPFLGERWWPARFGLSAPAVDLYEEKDEIVAKAEVPGIAKDDIQVNVTDHLLTIKGEKKEEEETKEKNYYRSERSYGAFSRSIELPVDVQGDKAKASFKNGVLEVRLPKSEEAKKKSNQIKVE